MIHMNLGSHDGRTLDELTSLVERICDSTEVSTERAAFTTSSARVSPVADVNQREQRSALISAPKSVEYSRNPVAASPESERVLLASAPTQSQPLSEPFIPKILSPEELKQAEDAFYFDLRSDFDEMYGREEFEEEV